MKTPITYYGGKQNLIPDILAMIPNHSQYVEVFFGGGAVFFAKPPSECEVINDSLDCAIAFYRVLKTRFAELNTLIQGTLHSESEYKKAKQLINSEDELLKAWAFWCRTQLSFSSQLNAGFAFSNSKLEVKKTDNKKSNFTLDYAKRLEQTQIFCRDALDIIKLKDSKDTFFYIDPPYVSSYCGHYAGYTHDDFKKLLDLLVTIKGKFLLSSYPEPLLLEYRQQHSWNAIDKTSSVSVSHKVSKKAKIECLTFNYSQQFSNQTDLLSL